MKEEQGGHTINTWGGKKRRIHIRTQVVIAATGKHCTATYSAISHSYGLFAADYSTLHPLGEVVLHDANIFVTVLGFVQ